MNAYEKMKMALINADVLLSLATFDKLVRMDEVERIKDKVKDALRIPPRNCDIGTAEELYERFLQFCNKKTHCEECPLYKKGGLVNMCIVRWAQLPYEKGGAE